MFLDAPTARRVSEVGDDHLWGISKGVVAVVDGDPDAALTKPNDVASLASCNICDQARVFGGKPPSRVLCKVLDDKEGLDIESVTQDNDSIETKADDAS